MLTRDSLTVARTGAVTSCLVDPDLSRIYLPESVDIIRGDTVAFRDFTRRIPKPVAQWLGAGLVVEYEDGPAYLPDLGELRRGVGYTFDENTGDRVPTGGTLLYSGPCHVSSDPYAFDTRTDVGAQIVGSSAFIVQVPLEVIDGKDGDTFQVTYSRDGRLLVRALTVKAARAHSDQLFRELMCFDNQGD